MHEDGPVGLFPVETFDDECGLDIDRPDRVATGLMVTVGEQQADLPPYPFEPIIEADLMLAAPPRPRIRLTTASTKFPGPPEASKVRSAIC